MNTSCGKFQYADKKAAKTAFNFRQHRRHGHRRGKVKRLRIYKCPECPGWHITSHAGAPKRTRRPALRHTHPSSILYHE